MRTHREEDGRWLLALERGDAVRESVERWAREAGVGAARLSGIGALEDPELGFYHLSRRSYERRVFPGMFELLVLEGNLSLRQGEPFLHAHAALAGPDFRVIGGHLFDARVAVVAELFASPYPTPLRRVDDPVIGLPRWSPGA